MRRGGRILHVAPGEKFIAPFADFVRTNFPDSFEQHRFWISPGESVGGCREIPNSVGDGSYFRLAFELPAAQKIFLHGLFDTRVLRILALSPSVLGRCYWIIWGGDLYTRAKVNRPLRHRVNKVTKAYVIRNVGNLVSYVTGDVELARRWYSARGYDHECLVYPSNVFSQDSVPSKPKGDGPVNILVGNSADPTNEHLEVLERIARSGRNDIQIYAPLSYGDVGYAEEVISHGKRLFGSRFNAVLDFLQREKYVRFLADMDIAVFNHRRQQAMGNIITLLGLGKTVFIRRNVTSWEVLSERGIVVRPVEELSLETLSQPEVDANAQAISDYFTAEVLSKQLRKIFED